MGWKSRTDTLKGIVAFPATGESSSKTLILHIHPFPIPTTTVWRLLKIAGQICFPLSSVFAALVFQSLKASLIGYLGIPYQLKKN